ncbi:MAG: DUF4296 domain-containing protein [Prevotellaceae bacterium]|nr:DUF4296 domain-containing protein [Prevotellaceae bacterium]
MRRSSLLSLLFVLSLLSCSVDIPSGIISQGKMERILYDYHIAQGMSETSTTDLKADRYVLVQQVLRKYGVTEEQFDSSMVWYSAHSTHLVEMYQHIDDRLQRESSALGIDASDDIYAHLTDMGDTAVVWRTTNVCMRNTPSLNIVSYTVHADSTFQMGDTYALRFKNRFVAQDGAREGYALLIARYEGDTLSSVSSRIGGDFDASMQIPQSQLTDTGTLSRIQVVFYLPYEESNADQFRLWMVYAPMLIRFHHQQAEVVEPQPEENDTTVDAEADTLAGQKGERLTPQQLRDSHEGERTINVTRQRKVVLPRSRQNQNGRRR